MSAAPLHVAHTGGVGPDAVAADMLAHTRVEPPPLTRPTGGAQWAILRQLFDGVEVDDGPSPLVRLTVRVVVTLAVVKAVLQGGACLVGYPIAPAGASLLPFVRALMFVGFFGPGLLMLTAGRRDRRAMYLGGFFLIIATAFVREPGRRVVAHLSGLAWVPLRMVLQQNLDAFLPFLLWLFAREFPRAGRGARGQRVMNPMVLVTAICGTLLSVFDAVGHLVSAWPTTYRAMMVLLGVVGRPNVYWAITFGLTVAAFPAIVVRSRSVAGPERVRTTWFVVSLVVGLAPLLLEVIVEALSPGFEAWAQSAPVRSVLGTVLFSLCLTIPASAIYAVVVKRVLAVRVVVRRALQCTLAKYLFVAACLMPLLMVISRTYTHRDQTIVDVATDPVLRIAIALAFAGVLALVFTERILTRIDALFFAPRYDAHAVLTELTPRLVRAANARALAELVRRTMVQTLSSVKTTMAIVASDPVKAHAPLLDRLPAESMVVDVLTSLRATALDVSDRLLRAVSDRDAAWLAQTGAQLLVPVKASDGTVLAVLALAERDDEQPYGREDRDLVARVAAAAALTLEQQRLRRKARARARGPRDVEDAAFECRACGRMSVPRASARCHACGEPLELSYLPLNLHGKFHVERRLGQGGMGIVYLATDVVLRRHVALKTLPTASVAAEQRLRGEARTMAQLSHPNLAAIYGSETWQGHSILIVEYLERGTLAATLARTKPSVAQITAWILNLCDGLQYLHEHQWLHGDIKPSNIGFDRQGTPKLLDFGLAGACSSTRPPSMEEHDDAAAGRRWGTRRYLCPNVATAPSCPQFDLWSLAVVLYEALAGGWPFVDATAPPDIIPDIRTYRPEVSQELARVLANALHSDMQRRARSVLEFSLWLNEARPIR